MRGMPNKQAVPKLLTWAPPLAALILLLAVHHGWAARCGAETPRVRQTQVGFGSPPVFKVVVQNICSMCPAIDVHIRCGAFPQRLADPRVLRVVGYDDCAVNAGLPLAPLQMLSFNYTHHRFRMLPRSWYFQCE